MSKWYCTRCGNDKDEGCGMPDYLVAVPYTDGPRMQRPACPLDLKNPIRRWFLWTLGWTWWAK